MPFYIVRVTGPSYARQFNYDSGGYQTSEAAEAAAKYHCAGIPYVISEGASHDEAARKVIDIVAAPPAEASTADAHTPHPELRANEPFRLDQSREVLTELRRRGGLVEAAEVWESLYKILDMAEQSGRSETVRFSRMTDGADMIVQFKKGQIIGVYPGPSLTVGEYQAIVDRLYAEVCQSPGPGVGRAFLLSDRPVTGTWRYADRFHILPPSPDAPQPSEYGAPHPFVLEFQLRRSSSWVVEDHRFKRLLKEWSQVLSALLNCRISLPLNTGPATWGRAAGAGPGLHIFHESYFESPDGPRIRSLEWSGASQFEPLIEEPPIPYYLRAPFGGRDVRVPASATAYLDRFNRLKAEQRLRFLRACYWISHAQAVSVISKSASFTALASAIESLVPDAGGPRCPECGRMTGPGPTERFNQFIDRFLPDHIPLDAHKKDLYRLRSAISHGSKIFVVDDDRSAYFFPDSSQQEEALEALLGSVRLCLHNWLLKSGS
jgi:hypothetical protein